MDNPEDDWQQAPLPDPSWFWSQTESLISSSGASTHRPCGFRGKRKSRRRHHVGSKQARLSDPRWEHEITTRKKKEGKIAEDYLGKRQQALNTKVNQAVADKVDFNNIKDANEASDLDKLFKIDVAAKYRNSDYIIDVLKSGDSLYISRALKKCLWLYDENHTHIINPEFIHSNILPFMSTRMKKKLLTAVSIYVRTEERAVNFYHYCMKIKLYNIAFKFLLFTPKEFKRDLMRNNNANGPLKKFIDKNTDYIKHLIGKSFSLLEICFNMLSDQRRIHLILHFKYFYTVNNDKYVECLEKYILPKYMKFRFSSKLSKDIMTKHKERVLKNPKFFEPLVNTDMFVKYTTPDDAKILAVALLPAESSEFWVMSYYLKYQHFLRKIPHEETYAFIKKIFEDRYPKCEFEMTREFYTQNYHQFMTQEEKEDWAFRHLKSEKQLLGVGCDYLWYQYISFKVSFEAVKHVIMVTKEPEKRLDMCNVLVKSARNNQELEQLFIYYDKRHSNEFRPNRDSFLRTVITHQNVFIFDEACWEAFYKLLLNMELYNVLDFNDANQIYKTVTLLYYILHGLAMNDGLKEYLLLHFETPYIYGHLSKLNHEKHEVLYTFLFKFYIDEIIGFKDQLFTFEVSNRMGRYCRNITGLISKFRPDTPVLMPRQQKKVYNQPKKTRIVDHGLSDQELIRRLKSDTDLIKALVPEVKECFSTRPFRIRNFLSKLKIYYSDDVAKTYLELFEDLVSKSRAIWSSEPGVFGIFQLADEKRKIDFINEYAPQDSKINHAVIKPEQLCIQKAICEMLGYSRPPLPLASVHLYLKGDYVKYCLKIFDMYHAHLPIPMCVQFVESIIDSPVSIQKHGIRLAFKCFDSDDLKKVITKIWNKTKNVSLRGTIYKALYEKLKVDANEAELLDALKSFTLTLHQDDQDDVLRIFHKGVLLDEYRGHYYEALWRAVSKFKDMQPNIDRKIDVVNRMYIDMYLLNEAFVRTVVDEHINTMLIQKKLHLHYSDDKDMSRLLADKWKLSARYIIHFATFAKSIDKYVKVTEDVVEKCIELWNEEYRGMNHFQELCSEFVGYLKQESYVIRPTFQNYENIILVYESILNKLMNGLPLHDIYMLVWDLHLTVINRRAIKAEKDNLTNDALDVWTDIIPKSSTRLGREVGNLIIEFVKNKNYFSYFIPDISKAIKSTAKDHLLCINGLKLTQDLSKVYLFVALGLLEHEFPETYMMAINMLPDPDHSLWISDEVGKVEQKVKNYPDSEVQSALYAKQHSKKKRYTCD